MLLIVGAALACPRPSEPAELRQAELQAASAMAGLDDAAFEAAVQRAETALECLGTPVSPTAAAAWHRTRALVAFTAGDRDAARRSLRAAFALDPDGTLPESVAPPGGALDQLVSEARAAGPPPRKPAGKAWFDGETRGRPDGVPTVLQVRGENGITTRELAFDEAWSPPPRQPSVPLLVTGGVAMLGAGGLFAVSALSRAEYDDLEDPVPTEDLPGLRARTNGTMIASAALGALGVVGIGVAFAW